MLHLHARVGKLVGVEIGFDHVGHKGCRSRQILGPQTGHEIVVGHA